MEKSNYDKNLKYLNNLDVIDLTNASQLDENFSNFRIFGIGKQTEKQKINQERRRAFRKDLKTELKGKDKWKALLTLSQRYNPAAAIPRAGVLAGARVNIFGISVRLYPAFLTPEEAKKKKIRVDAIAPAKKAWDKVSQFWRGLGGNPESLKKAVLNGYNKPVFKWTKASKKRIGIAKSGFDGSVSVVSVNNAKPVDYIPTSLPSGDRLEDEIFNEPHENAHYRYNPNELDVAYSQEGLIANGRVFLNEYGVYDYYSSADGDNIEQWWESNEFSNSEAGAIAIAAGIGLLGSIAGMIANAGAKKNPYEEGVNAQLEAEIAQAEKEIEPVTAEEMKKLEDAVKSEREMGLPPDDGSGADDGKIMGIPKMGFYIGLGVLALVGGFLVYKKFIKK